MYVDLKLGSLHEPLSGRAYTSLECRQQVLRRAALLRARGVQPGDRAFIHYGNRAEFFFDLLALWSIGGCAAPVDPRLTQFEIEVLLDAVQPKFSVWDRDPGIALATAIAARDVRVLAHDEYADDEGNEVLAAGLPVLDADALMLFTSGTTGTPKVVAHTHRSLRARFVSLRETFEIEHFRRSLCLTPSNFAWGLIGNSLFPWLYGMDLYLLPAFRADLLMRLGALCDQHAITNLPTVPAMWPVALRAAAPPSSGSLLRVGSGTSPLGGSLWKDVQKWSGTRNVATVYALTECGWIASASGVDVDPEDGLVGRVAGGEARILPTGMAAPSPFLAAECERGQPGNVWVQTPSLMRGYFGRDDLTGQVVRHGWFNTGDIGSVDERGLLQLRGREKEMINAGGVKVYPTDVDQVLAGSGLASDVCTFAMADPLQGEQVAVAVVVQGEQEAALRGLYAWARERLAAYQLPRSWFAVDTIPRTARGKLSRADVAKLCAARIAVDARRLAAEP